MTEILSKQQSKRSFSQRRKFFKWDKVFEKFKKTFGNDIYESWIKNIN